MRTEAGRHDLSRPVGARKAARAVATAQQRVRRVLRTLQRNNPAPRVELQYSSPLELLIATILSAQSTDQRVNQVTPALFTRYRTASTYADARLTELARIIRPTGLWNTKARNLIACGGTLSERFAGRVPHRMEDLVSLPGVGQKTANVVLGHAFGHPAIVVDTHVNRVSNRLGLTGSSDPDRIEHDLQRVIPRNLWTEGSQRLLLHGRYVCLARTPRCTACAIYSDCSWEGKSVR